MHFLIWLLVVIFLLRLFFLFWEILEWVERKIFKPIDWDDMDRYYDDV